MQPVGGKKNQAIGPVDANTLDANTGLHDARPGGYQIE
jgi:hypothetical protein